jgi:hypothetical protein
MNIEAEVKAELRINEGRVLAERRCGSGGGGERGVVGGGDGVTERAFSFASSRMSEEMPSFAQR